MSAIKVICLDIVSVNQQCRPYQDGERQKCNQYLQRGMQSMRHRMPPSERSSTSPYTCIGHIVVTFTIEREIEVTFFHWLPTSRFRPGNPPKVAQKKRRGHPAKGWPLL